MNSSKVKFAKNSAYFESIYGQFNELSRSCSGIVLVFLLPCLTKNFIMTRFSQNWASEVTFVRLAHTVG